MKGWSLLNRTSPNPLTNLISQRDSVGYLLCSIYILQFNLSAVYFPSTMELRQIRRQNIDKTVDGERTAP